jgi:AcrR family transcriptional regulator
MSYVADRRREEKHRRRQEITDAAEQLYAEVGWSAVTMEQVARRARLSRALLYVYFRDKADLQFAIVERGLALLRERFEAGNERHPRGLDRVAAMGRAYIAFALELPHYFDALSQFEAYQTAGPDTSASEQACILARHRVHEAILEALAAGMRDGSVRTDLDEPATTAVSLWGFTHGIIQIASTKSHQLAREGVVVQGLIEHACALLRRALAADPQSSVLHQS